MNLDELCEAWLRAKGEEAGATSRRRALEDEIHDRLKQAHDNLGKTGADTGRHKIRVTERMNRKVDVDLLHEIAAEHGLEDHLSSLFRWRPEVNMKAWQQADESITLPLAGAVTTKPGRPSFSIEEL